MSNKFKLVTASIALVLLGIGSIDPTIIQPISAHEIKVSGDVGGTMHIEPNDRAEAGKSTQVWIALTRKGGKLIPLQQCNCKLVVFTQPRKKDAQPILQPMLKSINAEGYKGVIGTDIVFPKTGAYEVKLTGSPKSGATFKPFELKFDITVAGKK